jgi:hypothetical protein
MRLVICSKSAWSPSIRREHAVARSAAADGHEVMFVERPLDVRALLAANVRGRWLEGLRPRVARVDARIEVMIASTLLPGHRSALAQLIDTARLRATLRGIAGIEHSVVVATQPWQWPAVSAVRAARRVFDCADDWRVLIPHRSDAIDGLYQRIGKQADAVILTSPDLICAFPRRDVVVAANGASAASLNAPVRPRPPERRMVYAGTLSERFDATLLREVLERLPDWSVELYGECRYAGHGDSPAAEVVALFERFGERIRWYGAVERVELPEVLDRARVLIAPQRATLTRGQDSMKLYDYASRDRPIVCTPGALGSPQHVEKAGVVEARTPADFASAVTLLDEEDRSHQDGRRRWLLRHSWEARWPAWSRAAFGDGRA